jgi:expansin (peptidoglycan-binding protein)
MVSGAFMKAVFSSRMLRCLFAGCACIAIAACDRGDGNTMETPEPVPLVAGESRDTGVDLYSVDAASTRVETFGDVHSGESTYYKATGKGNCSFDATDDLMVAAINTKDYANAAMCGTYLDVSGPNGSVIVRVVDRCPGCKPGGLDLSRQAFERIAETAAGRVPVSWQVVSGTISGPVAYQYMDGTTRYWTAIQLRNHRWPVATLEIMPKGASEWIRVERRAYNYFVHPRPIAAGPLRVRVSAATGETLEDELPEPHGGLIIQGAAQFQ